MSDYLVSIVIATYRRSEDLRRAIISAEEQTYDNCEILVVDDNDDEEWNENVKKIVDECKGDKKIRLIQNHPNQGSAKTRNIGISEAKGDFITFLDDDDLYLHSRIENQLKTMLSSKADYGITDLILYNENESVNEIRKRNYLNKSEGTNLLLCHLKYHLTGTDTLMFRNNYLKSIGGFDPIDSGDEYYLMMKAVQSGGSFCYSPVCDVKAYVHRGKEGLSSGEKKINGEKRLYQYKKQFFGLLKLKDRRYIRMRHYAVVAFAYLRMNQTAGFLVNGFLGFCISPIGCLKLISARRRKNIV